MATQADLLGVGHTFTGPDGAEYTLKPPTELQRAQYQRWLEKCARERIMHAPEYDAAARREQLGELEARIDAGDYEWGGPVCAARLNTPSGMARFLEIALPTDELTAKRLVEHRLDMICALLAAKAVGDPKAEATILHRLGLLPDSSGGTGLSHSSTRRGAGRRRKSRR